VIRSTSALVLAPVAALVLQSVMYNLVLPSCASQSMLGLHAAAAVALACAVGLALLAHSEWRDCGRALRSAPSDVAGLRSTRRFVSIMAMAISALSALVIVAMWFGAWVLSPCDPWP
jgi:hypothetical protein